MIAKEQRLDNDQLTKHDCALPEQKLRVANVYVGNK